MATYFDSLRRMHELPVNALFPAHGPVIANAKVKIQEYLNHRIEREKTILAAWQRGSKEPSTIVKEVYTDVPTAMHSLAERSVIAHLEKLKADGQL
jgi:glyoxylase-like metal-dependent hydrolase (beta-lactamase superfamily II)